MEVNPEAKELFMSLYRLPASVLLCALLCAIAIFAAPSTLSIVTLSSMPQFVSGGDALIEIRGAQRATVMLNGKDVSSIFAVNAERGTLVGLVTGLKLGP